jgi:polyisoprenoid-binding protein YceI
MLRSGAQKAALSILMAMSLAVSAVSISARALPPSPRAVYRISKIYSTLEFSVTKWMVFKEEGLFHEFEGRIVCDPAHPANSLVEVTAQAASLDTRGEGRDHVLRSDDFFDVEKYPTLSFRSTQVAAKDSGALDVAGDLTIHGVTHRITIPVKVLRVHTVPNAGSYATFETNFTIDRRDYSVLGTRWSGGQVAIDNTVYIHLILGGEKQ